MCWLLCGEIDDVEKFESLCTVGGNVKWHNLCGRQYSEHSKKLKIELPYDPAIPLLGIYPKAFKAGYQKIYLYIDVHISSINKS